MRSKAWRWLWMFLAVLFPLTTQASEEGIDGSREIVSRSIVGTAAAIEKTLGIPASLLVALTLVESNFGQNVGKRGRALSDGKFNRDAILAYPIAIHFGLEPLAVPASGRFIGGYGGAIGIAQVLPSTMMEYHGLKVTPDAGRVFSDWIGASEMDVKRVQVILNHVLRPSPNLATDGKVGAKTAAALARYHKHFFNGARGSCLEEVQEGKIGGCTKSHMLWHYAGQVWKNLDIRIMYDKSSDVVQPLLTGTDGLPLPGPANPWGVEGSLVTAALLLRDLGILKNQTEALGAYYAGESGMKNGRRKQGLEYAHKVLVRIPEAKRLIRLHGS